MEKAIKRIAPVLLLASLFMAPGPQTGGFGFGGNPRPNNALAFFEFAPANGAGMGSACQPVNWAAGSEQLDTWTKASAGGAAVPTVTANYALGPTGTMTAERIEIPATTAASSQWSGLARPLGINGPSNFSAWLKGTSTSGSVDLCSDFTPFSGCQHCTFTATEWTRCSYQGTGLQNVYIANMSITGYHPVDHPAVDVLVWGAMGSITSSMPAYIATAGASAGYVPTGAKGEALSFTRASTATCTKTSTGGLATTGIANGDLVLMPSGAPRVEFDGAGVLGLLVESSRQNVCLRSEAQDNASWSTFSTGVALPTRTADQAVSPDGATTAERVQFPATAVGQDSFVYQTVASASAAVFSIYVKGNGASGTFDVCSQSGTYSCTPCAFSSTSWTRCFHANAGAVTQVDFGNLTTVNGGVVRAANDVFVWGGQLELGTYATSYTPTTSVAVTRASDTLQVDIGASAPYANNMSMAISSNTFGAPLGVQGLMNANSFSMSDSSGTDALWMYHSGPGAIRCYSSGTTTGTVLMTSNVVKRGWCSVTTAGVTGEYGGLTMGSSGALSDPTYLAPARYINIGASPYPYNNDGIYSKVCVDPSPGKCR